MRRSNRIGFYGAYRVVNKPNADVRGFRGFYATCSSGVLWLARWHSKSLTMNFGRALSASRANWRSYEQEQ
jgi:hypothetical protein